jgi:hypothetical protein
MLQKLAEHGVCSVAEVYQFEIAGTTKTVSVLNRR